MSILKSYVVRSMIVGTTLLVLAACQTAQDVDNFADKHEAFQSSAEPGTTTWNQMISALGSPNTVGNEASVGKYALYQILVQEETALSRLVDIASFFDPTGLSGPADVVADTGYADETNQYYVYYYFDKEDRLKDFRAERSADTGGSGVIGGIEARD